MQFIFKTSRLEFAIEGRSVYLRVGRREWFWSREAGLVKD